MSPARITIERFGGVATVADLLGIHRSQVYRWDLSKKVGGQEGVIPSKFLRPLLLAARAMSVPITAEELILGVVAKPKRAARTGTMTKPRPKAPPKKTDRAARPRRSPLSPPN